MLQFITYPLRDLGAGIDQLSAESAIPEGFCEDLENVNPTLGGLGKRPGYQGKAGGVPVRVESVSQAGSLLTFTLDGAVDVKALRSSPLVVYGRTSSSTSGDFSTTDGVRYYPSFSPQVRKTFAASSSSSVAVDGDEHGLGTPFIFFGVGISDSQTTNANSVAIPDGVSIDQSSYDGTISYTNGSTSPVDAFVYYTAKAAVSGETYVSAATTPSTSHTISAATHGLSNFNITGRVFEDDGSTLSEIQPDSLTVSSSGDVTITFSSAPSTDLRFVLTSLDTANTVTGTAPASSSVEVLIENLTSPFIFATCYLESGTDKVQVLPDSIVVDTVLNTATITFENNGSSAATFYVYYEYGSLVANRLTVTAETSATFSDESPQLTIWGLRHEELYGTSTASRPGWVSHLDVYRSAGESRLVCGLGGNLFAGYSRDEAGTDYLMPSLYPNLRSRVDTSVTIAPAFYDTTDLPARTRGYLQFDGGGEGWATASATTYDAGTGWVRYTVDCPNLSISGTLSSIISATSGLEDELTVEQSGHTINSGTFKIKQISNPSTDTLYIWVDNAEVTSSDWDETGAGMYVGVFTDRIGTTDNSPYIPEDSLQSSLFGADSSFTVASASGTTTVVRGVTEQTDVPAGLQLVGSRTSAVIPLRTLTGSASVTGVVRGDNLSYTGIARELTVVSVNALANRSVTIDGDGETATVTLGSGDTTDLRTGQKVLLARSGVFSGVQTITDIPSSTTFEFASTEEASAVAGTLQGYTVEVDEELPWSDGVNSQYSLTVPERWLPVESPSHSSTLPPSTVYRHMDSAEYDEQPTLRSVMAADGLFLTNGADEVMEFDGTSLVRAGLPRWQADGTVGIDTSASALIDVTDRLSSATVTGVSGAVFTVSIAASLNFKAGNRIIHSDDGATYTVIDISSDATNGYVTVSSVISGTAAGTITATAVYSYYVRLNAVDANQNILASAVTGSSDLRVELSESSAITLRLIGPPAWRHLDYERIEVEVYRTALNTSGPFYRITTLTPQWDSTDGIIEFTDAVSDDTLRNLDPVNTALLGAELGTQWSHPLRSKYITAADNRLVLANITEDPRLDVRLVYTGTAITPAALDTKRFLFRRDSTDAGTSTNNTSRMAFEFVDASPGTISGITSTSTYFEVTTGAAHGLSVGSWVYLLRTAVTGDSRGRFCGWYQVYAVPTTTTFRVHSDKNATYSGTLDANYWTAATVTTDIPVYLGDDGNFRTLNSNPSGAWEQAAMRRLSLAINSAMRMVDTSISGQSGFEPWMSAGAGGDFSVGQLVVTQPHSEETTLEVLLPSFSGFGIAVNGVLRASAASASAFTTRHPSRLLVSYKNFPRIFNPQSSDITIDVSPSDGQEVTGALPFFAESSSGGKAGILAVFKERSIWVVDVNTGTVQQVASQGQGCTAPYSIAPTRNGILFANETGIWRLTQNLTVEYIGRRLDRWWKREVNRDELALLQGHFYAQAGQYKLSLPVDEDSANSEVAVYDTTREYTPDGAAMGSWTRYTNHPSTVWANCGADGLFGSTAGRVFSVRRAGDSSDYRDDGEAIAASATLRALDFGDAAVRKVVSGVQAQFRVPSGGTSGTSLLVATDMTDDFQTVDSFEIEDSTATLSGLSDAAAVKVQRVRFSLGRRRLTYLQLRLTNETKDEAMDVAGLQIRVAGLGGGGSVEAKDTVRNGE